MTDDARRAVERAARTSYGRLVALLAARGAGLAAAEDALAAALASALRVWPAHGVPQSPDAWLLTAARRNLGHDRARRSTADAGAATMILLDDERAATAPIPFGDERLKLMFVCAHPAIDPVIQPALMLQVVLGLDAARIAANFLVAPAAMGQRLVRAKSKIRDARIGFVIPAPDRIAERVDAVLAAIYAAYTSGWEIADEDLATEAIWLARLLLDLLPDHPEATGLLALMLYCEARRPARRDAAGDFVPLDRQDPRTWNPAMLAEAEALLRVAARYAVPGRFQFEAAIQSLHAETAMTGRGDAAALTGLYDLLVTLAPSVGAEVARACAYAEADRAAQALELLDALAGRATTYQPYWAARARVLFTLGRADAAVDAATTAAGLTSDPAVRAWLSSGGSFAPVKAGGTAPAKGHG